MKRTFTPLRLRRMLLPWLLLLALALSACTFTIQAEPTPPPQTPTPAPQPEPAVDAALLGTWQWEAALLDGQPVTVNDPSRYTLTFQADGYVAARFDCNSGGGEYTLAGAGLQFGAMITTLMGCPPDSQDGEFKQGLFDTVGYALDGDMLTLILATDGDSMVFSRVE